MSCRGGRRMRWRRVAGGGGRGGGLYSDVQCFFQAELKLVAVAAGSGRIV